MKLGNDADRFAFDPSWYLFQYPDVAAQGLDPWYHYCHHGKAEGRQPGPNRVLPWDHQLWRTSSPILAARLLCLTQESGVCDDSRSQSPAKPHELVSAHWVLAQWYVFNRDWFSALTHLFANRVSTEAPPSFHPGYYLLSIEAACHLRASGQINIETAECDDLVRRGGLLDPICFVQTALDTLEIHFPDLSDTALAKANAVFFYFNHFMSQGKSGGLCGLSIDATFPVSSVSFASPVLPFDLSASHRDADALRLRLINECFVNAGLITLTLRDQALGVGIDNLQADVSVAAFDAVAADSGVSVVAAVAPVAPLVSVIIPMHNAGSTIETALLGLFKQTYRPLELIVVDDASTDESADRVRALQTACPAGVSLYVVCSKANVGSYAARNLGLAYATGEFITTHDSDDWSHPQKIEKQVLGLLSEGAAMGCFSHWVRASTELVFTHWRIEPEGWTYRNMSSLMCRRAVFDALGSWDEVRVNADTEFHERLIKIFGPDAVFDVMPSVPLSFGRTSAESLSQRSETHLITQYKGVRHDYMASARRWHESVATPQDLYLPPNPEFRPFPAPRAICATELEVQFVHPLDEIQVSGLFNATWYVENNIDLQNQIVDPLTHYWEVGATEGRDPGPNFSTSGYLAMHPELSASQNPLLHFVRRLTAGRSAGTGKGQGKRQGAGQSAVQAKGFDETVSTGFGEQGLIPKALQKKALPIFRGRRRRRSAPTVLLVGHSAGDTLYGAERSLIDLAKAIDAMGYNLVVVLPTAINQTYVQTLQESSLAVSIIPFGWWQTGKKTELNTVEHFRKIMQRYNVDLVHVNTLVLDEPFIAARTLNIPSLVHVRELPEHDQALCTDLNASADQLRARLLMMADGVIANSRQVANWLQSQSSVPDSDQKLSASDEGAGFKDCGEDAESAKGVMGTVGGKPLFHVINTVEMERLIELPLLDPKVKPSKGQLVVGMLSSNLPKKGLDDVAQIAHHLDELDAPIVFVLYGPLTPSLQAVLKTQSTRGRTPRIRFGGYVQDPAMALAKVDVLINVSQFQESFGRTVLEAMAAARPVVGYAWGALPELVIHGQTGFLEAFGDTQAVAKRLLLLHQQPDLLLTMGQAGRQHALDTYSLSRLCEQLTLAYESFG